MTLSEIYNGLENIFPKKVTNTTFGKGKAPEKPYVAIVDNGGDGFFADGKLYYIAREVGLELYTSKKDLESERKIEGWLEEHNILWNCDTDYIDEESAFKKTYNIEIDDTEVEE